MTFTGRGPGRLGETSDRDGKAADDRRELRRAPAGGEATPDDRAEVRRELNRLRELAGHLRLEDIRQGTWFARLLRHSLDTYVREVDAPYLRRKYPGMSVEAVVQARISLAARQAGIEGALSAGAYTGAVAATLGSGGGASPLTLPAAGASFVLDLLFTSTLQLRLAHDVAVLYRVPLDLDDPEDLWKLIRVAFAIKGSEAGREVIGKGVPVVLRPVIKKIFSGSTLAAVRSLPVVGRYLLQRNLIKFSIPAVGVPLSTAINYWSTRTAGAQAVKVFRREGWVVDAARRMTERNPSSSELLWVLWLIIKADGLIHEDERLLLKHVTGIVRDVDSELAALGVLEVTGDLDQDKVWSRVADATGDRAALYDAAVAAAAIDGKVNPNELKALRKLAQYCSVSFDEGPVRRLAAERP